MLAIHLVQAQLKALYALRRSQKLEMPPLPCNGMRHPLYTLMAASAAHL